MSFLSDVVGGVSSLGNVISGGLNFLGSQEANSSALQIARENNATAIDLANTAHQREVKDLKAAGLNPILSATGGNGSAVPSLQTAPVHNTLSGIANSAQSMAANLSDVALKMAQVDNVSADTENKRVNNALLSSQVTGADLANKIAATEANYRDSQLFTNLQISGQELQKRTGEAVKSMLDVTRTKLATQLDQLNIHSATAAANLADIDSSFYLSQAGQLLRKLQLGGKATDDAASPIRHWIPFLQ